MIDDWRPIESWTPEDGDDVEGYWQYRDQAGLLTDGWAILERYGDVWQEADGTIPSSGLYTHIRRLTRPRDVKP